MTLDITVEVKTMIDDLKSRGYRRQTLATALGVSEDTVCKWASCRRVPKENKLAEIYSFYQTALPAYEPGMFK